MTNTAMLTPEVLGWDELGAMFGSGVVAELAGPDPFEAVVAPDVDPLAAIARCERLIAMLQGEQLAAMAAFMHAETAGRAPGREADGARDSAYAQIALCLGVAPRSSDSLVGEALDLSSRLPRTLAALCAGALTLSKARVILEETANLDVGQCARLEPELLALAPGRTRASLRRMTRSRVEKIDAAAVKKRSERARAERRVQIWPEPDGMYALRAYLPAEEAIAVFGVIDTLARANQVAGEELGIDALRADALVDLVLNPGTHSRVKYEMRVLVPFGTLLGTDDTPGHVPGQGPIPAEVTRLLAADSTWRRLLTDPCHRRAETPEPPQAWQGKGRPRPRRRPLRALRSPRRVHPHPRSDLSLPRLPPIRLAHRPRPHDRFRQRWTHDPDQPRRRVQAASQDQAPLGLDRHPGPRRHPDLHHTPRAGLPHQTTHRHRRRSARRDNPDGRGRRVPVLS